MCRKILLKNKSIYEKADRNEVSEMLLDELENKAIDEIKEVCGILYYENNKKNSYIMSRIIAHDNIKGFQANQPTYEIIVKLSDIMPISDGCSVLYILDELEQIDKLSKTAILFNKDWKMYIIFSHMWKESFWMIEERWNDWKNLIEILYPWVKVEFTF